MSQEWNIRARAESCRVCQKPFADGQPYCSRLVFAGEAGYERGDFCEGCWLEAQKSGEPFSAWRGTFRAPPPAAEPALKKETAETLFRKLIAENAASNTNSVYILGVMLERRRVLIERDVQTRQTGERILVYEHRKTGESFLVVDPQLRLDQLEPVQREIVALLEGARPAPAAGTGDAASPVGAAGAEPAP